ncbi:hypothetical protein K3495_g8019 [Podosphaera aphanis]|nr:hypothetical protein K3495_g8019 [Podosphaera aphanis]
MHGLDRVAMCVDSTRRIPMYQKYDVILVDEAGAVRRHMVSDFMHERGPGCRKTIRRLVGAAKTTIVTQFQLMESDVQFWGSFAGMDLRDAAVCCRWVVPAAPWCPPMRYSDNLEQTVWQLRKCYLDAYDRDADRTSCPIVVFCSYATHATMLLSYWMGSVAPTAMAKSRVCGIWGAVQTHSFARRFLADPNACAPECDILFVTPILQAGHSLDKWFKLSFSLLTNSHLNHRDEFQFTARLRQRPDLIPYRYAYIEDGLGWGRLADEKRVAADFAVIAGEYGELDDGEGIVFESQSEAHAELADTRCHSLVKSACAAK